MRPFSKLAVYLASFLSERDIRAGACSQALREGCFEGTYDLVSSFQFKAEPLGQSEVVPCKRLKADGPCCNAYFWYFFYVRYFADEAEP
jgi:hypothetical protein